MAKKKNVSKLKEPPKMKAKIKKVELEFKKGTLHSGSKMGPLVTNPKQALAIALSEGRKAVGKKRKKKTSKK